MLKKICLALFLFFLVAAGIAQKPSVKYDASFSAGLLIGDKDNSFQLQAVNGMRYKTWAVGLGIGLDDYGTRSVPLFLQVKKAVQTKPEALFVYADAGYNMPYLKEADKTFTEKAKGGFYGEGGIGYELPVLKKQGVFFGLGWRVKTFTLKVNTMPFLSVWPTPEIAFRNYDYTLSSLVFKTGFRF
jgi:hypothetical protein